MHPISLGFCQTGYDQVPGLLLMMFFLIVFLPMAIYDVQMFRGNFSYGKNLIITLILSLICMLLHIGTRIFTPYFCKQISRYMPSEFYFILFFFIFSFSQLTIPLIKSLKLNRHVDELEITKKGLEKVFEDEELYKEFFEYAAKKRSVEYAIFHVEYMEFKALFNDLEDNSNNVLHQEEKEEE